jgi:L-threonylcarbamoyladenylate synthase
MIYFIPTDTCYGIACEITDSRSYEKIYSIKKRDWNKPLAIMVENFEWLKEYTPLNNEQIDFLKTYDKPFTILTDCNSIKHMLQFEDEEMKFENKEVYKKIAFRVAHNKDQKKLIKKVGPIFLTSANISNQPEIFERKDLEKKFEYFIKK